ncbi:MAG: hypothetical protein JO182_13110 [Acidobacteriaceae bacterium]|nr:hypothetical protein [Acidobacteriaceae bacterium]MBV9035421.1 hypothetical protein [Acidobacteriaceae bacterium]
MPDVDLKLKQASAVLGVTAKDLQNLVQLKVIQPPRRNSAYRFDRKLLLKAKVAFYLKHSLGSSSDLLARFTETVFRDFGKAEVSEFRNVRIHSTPFSGKEPVEVKIPVRSLAKELEEQLPRATLSPDLPKGRKDPKWKATFLKTLEKAAADLGEISEQQISQEIARYRKSRKKLPEITVVGASKKKTA